MADDLHRRLRALLDAVEREPGTACDAHALDEAARALRAGDPEAALAGVADVRTAIANGECEVGDDVTAGLDRLVAELGALVRVAA